MAVAQRWPFGATTVSASLALADRAGVRVFATGGIGGVHRGAADTGDVSADLGAIASHPLVTVCAGAKAFLDLGRTLEELERIGVPVLGWRHDEFPAFYTRSSGLPVPHRVETAGRGGRRAGQPGPARRWVCSSPCPSPRPTPSTRWRSTPRSTGRCWRPAPPA